MKIEPSIELMQVLNRVADGLHELAVSLKEQTKGNDDFIQVVAALEKVAADLRREFGTAEFYFLGSLEYAEIAKMRCAWTEDWQEDLRGPAPKVLHRKEDSLPFYLLRRTPLGIVYASLTQGEVEP